jgi:hypothetical protein
VAGEGLAGVVVAILVGAVHLAPLKEPILAGAAGELGALVVVAAVFAFLVRAGRDRGPESSSTRG